MSLRMVAIFTIVFLPFVISLLILFFSPRLRNAGKILGWAAVLVSLVCLFLILSFLPRINREGPLTFHIGWIKRYGIELSFLIDGLSLLFGILISGIGLLVIVYSIWYLSDKEDKVKFYLYLFMFMGAMLGLVFSNNLIGLYTFWELTSVSSFLLIGFWYHKERSRYGAMKALIITGLGSLGMLGGFILLYTITETFDILKILTMGDVIRNSPLYAPALFLIFLGCATKSAQFPFHIWLPNAMEAPTPISAYLHSATMVKGGIFLVARLFPAFSGTPFWTYLVAGVGMATLIAGGVMAFQQTDLKALLAYSTISQLGMIMALLGFGTQQGAAAAMTHLLNHAAFKAALFMIVGIIDHECGTRDLRYLGGLRKKMPYSFAVALVGCLSMAGLPVFGGFISKEMFYESALDVPFLDSSLIPFLSVVAGIFTAAYSFKFLILPFFSPNVEPPPRSPHEASRLGIASPAILAGMVILLGIAPSLFAQSLLEPAATAVAGRPVELHLALWHGADLPLLMSLVSLVGGTLLFSRLKEMNRFSEKILRPLSWFSPNFIYDKGFLEGVTLAAQRSFRKIQSGYLKHYLFTIVGFVTLSTFLFSYFKGGSLNLDRLSRTEVTWPQIATFVLLVCSTIATVLFKSRISAIISLGMTGFLVAFFYVLMGAPDLALTQYLVEAVSVILFLLVFYFVPPFFEEASIHSTKVTEITLSVAVGVTMSLYTYVMMGSHLSESIASYYLEASEKLAGGRNVVNVVIVDFRGFDTMFEISVLSIAVLGIYAMLRLKQKQKTERREVRPSR